MHRNFVIGVVLLLIVLGGLFLRLSELDYRPMHHDEANQAVRAGILLEKGEYRYDPYEHHGPSLYYLSLPSAWLTVGRSFEDTTETTFRIVPALFGVGLLLLMVLLYDGMGWPAVLTGVLLAAVSPAMVYYSRYFVQEMLLVFFTAGAIVCGWRYSVSRKWWWMVLVGFCLGMMHATKETCVISYAGMAVALLAVFVLSRTKPDLPRAHIVLGVAVAVATSVILFSSFFTHYSGVIDSVMAYVTYLKRGGGNTDHVHDWNYYLKILLRYKSGGLVWSEAVIPVLAMVGAAAIFTGRGINGMHRGLLRFLLIYTVFVTTVYSAISYKTPWCMLSFLHGMILLAGVGAVAVFRAVPYRAFRLAWVIAIFVAVFNLYEQSSRANFRYSADARNPYAYAHTVRDFLNLVKRIDDIAAVRGDGKNLSIAVVTNEHDAWPAPWYLRGYRNVGYWGNAGDIPPEFNPAIILASMDKVDQVNSFAANSYQSEYWGLRPGVHLLMYIRKELWDSFVGSKSVSSEILK